MKAALLLFDDFASLVQVDVTMRPAGPVSGLAD
ncbi:hypothetical protein GGE65_007153 [Skermanella aerolata]